MTSAPPAPHGMPLSAAETQADGRLYRIATYALIALCCAPALFLDYLPMRELPQYAALSRMLLHLNDPEYGFAKYYELDFTRGASVLPLWLLGVLADFTGLEAATKLIVWASLALGLLGMCALLRALGKPIVLALLGMPFVYANAFYLGLIPSLFSTALALWAIAWLLRLGEGSRAQSWLAALSCMLPVTHPMGMIGVLLFAACYVLAHGRSWRRTATSLWPLTPLVLGALYWLSASLHADGVAAPNWPSIVTRVMLAPRLLIGGWNGNGDAWLLVAACVLWIYLCRPTTPRESAASLASWCFAALLLLGYLLLPSSTGSSSAICERAGSALLAWLPALVPNAGLKISRQRGPLLLIALAASSCWYTSNQLIAFSTEAESFNAVLAKMPQRPKLWTLAYDSQGALSRSNPYVHIAAYAQAQRGGFLSLSQVDYGWTAPLRRKKDAPAPAPVYGSEWDPNLVQVQLDLYHYYDNILMIGKEPREQTIIMHFPFVIAAHSGMFVFYTRPSAQDPSTAPRSQTDASAAPPHP